MANAIDTNTAAAAAESRRPVLLQVLPALESGGAERGAVDVAIAALEAGWTSLVTSAGGRMVHELQRAGVEHIELGVDSKNPLHVLGNARRLEALIRTRNVDIVHARSRAPAWSAALAARRAGRVFVTTFHAAYGTDGPAKKFYNRIMTRGVKVVAISDFIASHIRDTYDIADGRVVTIHRGIDLKKFNPAAVSAERVIKLFSEWRMPDGVPVILLPGRLSRLKGHGTFIEAIAAMGRRDVLGLIVGHDRDRGQYRRELEEQIRRLELEGSVRTCQHCADMPAAYMLADVVVSTSNLPEGFGRVPVEAQAMGRPVVAADHGGARETVLEGRTGWLVPPNDPDALAGALTAAVAMKRAGREAVAIDARRHVEARFSVERMCRETLDVYAELLSRV